jgi:glutamate-1-semialdehyde 2,1-aminomutase
MFQYYLKDANVSLSWVGTGRLLFSLDWQKADYDRLLDCLLTACEGMKQGGWWEPPVANIKVKLMKEVGAAVLKNALW